MVQLFLQILLHCVISGSHYCIYVTGGLLGSNAVWTYRYIPAFQKNPLPPSSGLNKHWYLPSSSHGPTTLKMNDTYREHLCSNFLYPYTAFVYMWHCAIAERVIADKSPVKFEPNQAGFTCSYWAQWLKSCRTRTEYLPAVVPYTFWIVWCTEHTCLVVQICALAHTINPVLEFVQCAMSTVVCKIW
jgi:hypothetical protein